MKRPPKRPFRAQFPVDLATLKLVVTACQGALDGKNLGEVAVACQCQPDTVTKKLNEVEKVLDIRLLARKQGSSATVVPDVTGPFAREADLLLKAMKRLLSPSFFGLDRVRLGMPPSVPFFFLPTIIEELQRDWPPTHMRQQKKKSKSPGPVELEAVTGVTGKLFEMLRNRLLDAVIETRRPGGSDGADPPLVAIPLFERSKFGLIFRRTAHPTLTPFESRPAGFDFDLLEGKTVFVFREEAFPTLYTSLLGLLPPCRRVGFTTFAEIQNAVQQGLGVGLGYPAVSGRDDALGFIDLKAFAVEKLEDPKHLVKRPKVGAHLRTLLREGDSALFLHLRAGWDAAADSGGLLPPARKVVEAIDRVGKTFTAALGTRGS